MPPSSARLPPVAFSSLVEPLIGVWKRRVGGAVRQALLALGFACLFGAAHLARVGTSAARLGAGAVLVGFVALVVVWMARERRAWASGRRALARVLVPTDPALAGRALRTFALLERAQAGTLGASVDLAELHFQRLLSSATPAAIERSAGRVATRWRWVLLVLAGGALAAFAWGPMRVVEGLNVLVARGGSAPLPMVWLHYPTVTMQPPAYLRAPDRLLLLGSTARIPRGALVLVRGQPTRPDRLLVLTDGEVEVPFVSDGAGGVVAGWTVESDAELRVAARFGNVLVTEPERIGVVARPDEAPTVWLEGAPRELSLQEVGRIAFQYEAQDDHGLRQIDLVLRAGNREDRRVLSRLNGEARAERGGHALVAGDPFLRRMFLPIFVTVEARDNDPLEGPKWGHSAPITLVPPPLGAPEAQRMQGLLAARNMIVDLLAHQITANPPSGEVAGRIAAVAKTLEAAVDPDSPLPVADGLRAFLRGQIRVLTAPPRPGASLIRRTEDVLLAVDVAIERLAVRDARSVAQRLADVADEVAAGAREVRETEKRGQAEARLHAALTALHTGTAQLLVLGALGRDLGSVAQGELDRIERSRRQDQMLHAELAAKHLAARLRRPNPSFASQRSGGVESGGGVPIDSGEASQADQRFDELARELEHLALEHAGEIGAVERALGDAEQQADLEDLRDEARERARDVRRAVASLPLPGAEPGSARSSAAIGREHAGAMSQSLEQLAFEGAVESGKRALSNLDEAERKARAQRRNPADWLPSESLEEARGQLREQVTWAEEKLQETRRQAEAHARDALRDVGRRERQHAQRAGNLSSRGRNDQTSLPPEVLRNLERAEALMNDAARELEGGHGDPALELQREAQRLLEQASQGRTTDESHRSARRNENQDAGRGGLQTQGKVPEEAGDRAQDFRQRVLRGLREDRSGALAPAVRRYAEGLLR